MVEQCLRTNQIPDLIDLCRKERPHIEWPQADEIIADIADEFEQLLVETEPSSEQKAKNILLVILLGTTILLAVALAYLLFAGTENDKTETQPNAFEEKNGFVVMEAENYSGQIPGSYRAADINWTLDGNELGSLGNGTLKAQSETRAQIDVNTNDDLYGPALYYIIEFEEAGDYYVYIRGIAPKNDPDHHDSIHVGFNGEVLTLGREAFDFDVDTFLWEQDRYINDENTFLKVYVPEPGTHLLNIWMRENGVGIDRIVLSKNEISDPDNLNEMEETITVNP